MIPTNQKKVNAINNANKVSTEIQNTYNKGIASGKSKEEVLTAMRDKLKSTGQYDTVKNTVTPVINNITPTTITPSTPTTNTNTAYTTNTELVNTAAPVIEASNITDTTSATNAVIDQTKANLTAEQQAAKDLTNATNIRTEEDKTATAKKEQQAIDYAKKFEDLTKQYEAQAKEQLTNYQTSLNETYAKNIEAEKTKYESLTAENKAATELQKYKDEQAVTKANTDLEVARMQNSWALNKLGIGGSTYAVNNAERISREGATTIAGLKLTSAYNEASAKAKITEQEVDYAKAINSHIDTYTDKVYTVKNEYTKLIADTKNSLLLNEKEKNDNINKLQDDYIKSKRDNEDKLFEALKKSRDEQLTKATELKTQITNQENTQKERINTLITNGNWAGLTTIEKNQLADKTGMSLSEIENTQRNTIYSGALKIMSGLLGNDFLPTVAETDTILSETNRLMLAGRPLEEALTIATNRIIKANPTYTKILESNTKKSSGTGTSKIKTSDMKQDSNGVWYAWTGSEWANTGLSGKTSEGTAPSIEQDSEGNLLKIDKNTGLATPILQQEGTTSQQFYQSTKEGEKGTGQYYQVPSYKPVKGKVSSGTTFTAEQAIDLLKNYGK